MFKGRFKQASVVCLALALSACGDDGDDAMVDDTGGDDVGDDDDNAGEPPPACDLIKAADVAEFLPGMPEAEEGVDSCIFTEDGTLNQVALLRMPQEIESWQKITSGDLMEFPEIPGSYKGQRTAADGRVIDRIGLPESKTTLQLDVVDRTDEIDGEAAVVSIAKAVAARL